MSSPPIIVKHYYVQTGSPPPLNSRYKGETVTTSGIIGTIEYTGSKHADDISLDKLNDASINWLLKQGKIQAKDGTFNYTNKHDETITNHGYIENQKQRIAFMKEADNNILDNGHIVHYFVISMKDYVTAADYGYYTYKEWTQLAINIIPDIAKNLGYDKNSIMWWADFHHDKFNPHMHLQIFEKKDRAMNSDELYDQERGTIPAKKLNKIKREILEKIYVNQKIEKDFQLSKKQYLDQLDESMDDLIDQSRLILVKPCMIPSLKELQNALPKTGRLQYNSKNILPYKREINRYVDYILDQEGIKEKYHSILEKTKYLDHLYNEQLGDKNVSKLTETRLKKIKEGIGNQVLDKVKNLDLEISDKDYDYLSLEDRCILNMMTHKDLFKYVYSQSFGSHIQNAIEQTILLDDIDLIHITNTDLEKSVETSIKNVVSQQVLNNVNANRYSFTKNNINYNVKYTDQQIQNELNKYLSKLDFEIQKELDEFIKENGIDLFDFRNDLILSDGTVYSM